MDRSGFRPSAGDFTLWANSMEDVLSTSERNSGAYVSCCWPNAANLLRTTASGVLSWSLRGFRDAGVLRFLFTAKIGFHSAVQRGCLRPCSYGHAPVTSHQGGVTVLEVPCRRDLPLRLRGAFFALGMPAEGGRTHRRSTRASSACARQGTWHVRALAKGGASESRSVPLRPSARANHASATGGPPGSPACPSAATRDAVRASFASRRRRRACLA